MSGADEAELWAAIVAHPEDDVARLVYADWLSEHSDPRGELIALQVQQMKLREGTASWVRIQRRVDVLLAQNWARWEPKVQVERARRMREPTKDPADHRTDWSFERGFPERLRTVPQLFLEYAAEVRAAAPLLWDVTLDCGKMPTLDPAPWVDPLVTKLAGVRHLALAHTTDSALIVFAGRPELQALQGLSLEHCRFGIAGPDALAHRHSSLLGLSWLELSQVNLNETSGTRLFKGAFTRLRELRVRHETLGLRTCAAMGALASGMRKLDLSWCTLANDALEKLLFAPLSEQLVELNLSYLTAGEPLGEWLRAPPKSLRVLRLTQSRLSPGAVRALIEAEPLSQLDLLDVAGVSLGDSEANALLARFGDRVLFRTET
ncbi:MAG: TIGR02996 domain-containing protein [Myxococcaceae bacterium]